MLGNTIFENILSLISLSLLYAITLYTVTKINRKRPLHLFFISTVILCILWTMSILLMNFFPEHFILLHKIAYFSICLIPVTFFLSGYSFAKTNVKLQWQYVLLLVIPVVSLIIVWTNEFHHLFFEKVSPINSEITYGPYFMYHAIYSYLLISIGFFCFIYFSIKNSGLFSRQAILITIGSAFPLIANMLMTFKLVEVPISYDTLFFSLMIIFYFYAIFRHDFLNVLPIALKHIVDHISDGFMVFSREYILIDYNRTFTMLFPPSMLMRKTNNILPWAEQMGIGRADFEILVQNAAQSEHELIEKEIFIQGEKRTYQFEITPVKSEQNHVATILLIKDITSHKRNIEMLEFQNQKLDHINMKLQKQNESIEAFNRKLKELAEVDELTGAYNRRFFNEYYEIEIFRALNQIEYNQNNKTLMNFCIAILDIDNFKHVNDTYGHIAGDQVLRQLVQIVKDNVFSRDIVCRYGGEEFAVIFTKTTKEGAVLAAEKIRAGIESHGFILSDTVKNHHVTASIGLAAFCEDDCITGKSILKLADDRLYKAKMAGKNRVIAD